MRDLLFLSHRIPYPPNKGDKVRAWHFLQHFAETRRVHLGCFVDEERDWAHLPFLKSLCGDTCFVALRRPRALARSLSAFVTGRPMTLPYYHDRRLARWVRRLRRERPMPVFAYSSSMAQYATDDRGSTRIIDFVDVDSQKWSEYARHMRWPLSAVYRREGDALLRAERRIAGEFDASIFVSDAEAALFRRLAPESSQRVFAVSIGVDAGYYSPDHEYPDPYGGAGSSALCFTGMMDYWPNVDAVTWFVTTIFPRLRAARPSTTFWIVGANPVRAVRRLAEAPGVFVTGRVPDTRPFLMHASVVVAPLRIARGIQSKVLEAMAMGRPVIASEQAFQGLTVVAGRDLMVARNANEFVAAIRSVWDENPAGALGARARQAVRTCYDWAPQLSSLDAVLAPFDAVPGTAVPILHAQPSNVCQ
jgi:sugar transferase (PEP-CTERM/EpsH1 system associated)